MMHPFTKKLKESLTAAPLPAENKKVMSALVARQRKESPGT